MFTPRALLWLPLRDQDVYDSVDKLLGIEVIMTLRGQLFFSDSAIIWPAAYVSAASLVSSKK